MPFLVDDIFLRMLGISIPPFDMLWMFETIHDFAIRETYDPEKISDSIKENRMLYELGEIPEEEYERVNAELLEALEIAKRAREMKLEHRIDILGIGG